MRRKPFVVAISGPSGAGKTTFVRFLLQRFKDMRFSVSATTRACRPGEQDGREYHFLGTDEFRRRIATGDFLEHAEVYGLLYGTLRSEVVETLDQGYYPLLDVDVQGGVQVKQKLPDSVLVFLLPPSMRALEERLRGRKTESEERIQKRLQDAPNEIRSLAHYDYVVINDDVERAQSDVEGLVRAERLRSSRLTDDAGGPDPAAEYLKQSGKPLQS